MDSITSPAPQQLGAEKTAEQLQRENAALTAEIIGYRVDAQLGAICRQDVDIIDAVDTVKLIRDKVSIDPRTGKVDSQQTIAVLAKFKAERPYLTRSGNPRYRHEDMASGGNDAEQVKLYFTKDTSKAAVALKKSNPAKYARLRLIAKKLNII